MIAAALPGDRLHLQHGPIDLIIGADGARAAAFAAAEARFATVLDELVGELPLLRRAVGARPRGEIARAMHAACLPHGTVFVTPMAAVAGAVADTVLAAMVAAGSITRAYVNNGGDIAVFLGETNTAQRTAPEPRGTVSRAMHSEAGWTLENRASPDRGAGMYPPPEGCPAVPPGETSFEFAPFTLAQRSAMDRDAEKLFPENEWEFYHQIAVAAPSLRVPPSKAGISHKSQINAHRPADRPQNPISAPPTTTPTAKPQAPHFTLAMRSETGRDRGRITLTAADPVRGIASSGRGGRSLSLGIADQVTVLARTAAAADVAATLIANAVDLPGHPAIARQPARDLDPDSDLGARLVTTGLGRLSADEQHRALARGAALARTMVQRGLIQSAALFLGDHSRTVDGQIGVA